MKKSFAILTIISIASLMLFNSCEPEVVTPPILTVTPAETVTAVPGEQIMYHVILSSDTDLTTFSITVKLGETLIAFADTVFPENIQSSIMDFPFVVPMASADASNYAITFDAKNTSESTIETRMVTVNIPYGEINSYTAVILSDIENPNGSSFFSLEDNQRMQLAAAKATSGKVDIIYYYGATNKATICAPADQGVEVFDGANGQPIVAGFAIRNNTKLAAVTMTEADFNAIVNDGPITSKMPANTSTAVTKLAIGNILYAETVGGKKALILVKNITGGQGTSEITIEVKIQQ